MTNKEKWIKLFEQVVGRKPTADEFLAGKQVDFDLKQIRSIAGLGDVLNPTSVGGPISDVEIPSGMAVAEQLSHEQFTPGEYQPDQVSKKSSKIKLFLLALLVLCLGGTYYYFSQKIGKEATVSTFTEALADRDYDQVAKLLSSKDNTWTKEEAQGFLNYLSEKDIDIATELKDLANQDKKETYRDEEGNRLFGLQETSKRFGIFQDYQVVTYPIDLVVGTNLDKLTVNGIEVKKDQETNLGQIKFAPHYLDVKAETEVGEIDAQVLIDLHEVTNNQSLINLETVSKQVQAVLPEDFPDIQDPKLLINGKEVADSLSENMELLINQELEVGVSFIYEGETYLTETEMVSVPDEESVLIDLVLSPESQDKLEKAVKAKSDKQKAEQEAKDKAAEEAARQASNLWNPKKEQQLADFMVGWGNSMDQPGYEKIDLAGGAAHGALGALIWQGSALDASYSATGRSNSEYTIVAAYVYYRGDGLRHVYHFAILPDGRTTVIYSERASGIGYVVSKLSTENADLLNGFASIVYP